MQNKLTFVIGISIYIWKVCGWLRSGQSVIRQLSFSTSLFWRKSPFEGGEKTLVWMEKVSKRNKLKLLGLFLQL